MNAADIFNGILKDFAAAQVAVAPKKDTYRGWLIEESFMGGWEATHPDYDPTPAYYGAPDGDSRSVVAPTRATLIAEIDAWFEEHSA